MNLLRISDRVLEAAAALPQVELRSLDAIHLATAQQPAADLASVVTYDGRMTTAANSLGWIVASSS